jgi:hypothetical protein
MGSEITACAADHSIGIGVLTMSDIVPMINLNAYCL